MLSILKWVAKRMVHNLLTSVLKLSGDADNNASDSQHTSLSLQT